MAWRTSHSLAAGTLAAGALLWVSREAWPWRRPLTAPPIVVTAAYADFADTLGRRETLSDVLERAGIVGQDYAGLITAATKLPVRKLRPGLVFHFRRLQSDSIAHRVMVQTSPERRLWLERRGGDSGGGWVQTGEAIPWSVTRLTVSGAIETSLYDALDQAVSDTMLPAGERRALAWAIADVYDWEVDFTRDLHPGDRFEVLIERLESPDAERRFGRILAARVDVAGRPSYAFYFAADPARAGFYDEDGRSLRRAFLRAPLQFRRVSGRFGGRYHPVLHHWRRHEGTDYAAAYGTPVRATADGLVTKAQREDGYGNLVELRHVNGIRTRYGHLSKIAEDVRVAGRVRQGQTVGYVGSTGLSTGPHLHYEFLVNGHPTNPQRKDAGAGMPVPKPLRAAFDSVRARLLAQLEPPPPPPPPASPSAASSVAARDD